MKKMTDIFAAFLSTFDMLISLVGNFLNGIVQLLTYIPMAMSLLTGTIIQMPTVIQGFATALVFVSVAYLIIGR